MRTKKFLVTAVCFLASAALLILRYVSLHFVPSLLESFRLLGVVALVLFCVGWGYLLIRLR